MTAAVPHNARSADKQRGCGFSGEVDAPVTLSRGERRVLELIRRCDFTGQGCWPTQEELAFLSGYKRPYVNSLTMSLRKKGLIRVEKRRRPGCKWTHNVYFVRDWSPNVRRGICNLRRNFQDSRARGSRSSFPGSDTERTATASRAQTPPSAPSPRCTSLVSQRCGRESASKTGLRRISMDQRRHLRLEVDCPECARKDQIIRQYAENHSKLVEEVSGAQEVARAVGKENATLKRRRTREAREDARAEQIMQVGEYWLETHPRAKFPEGEKRWELVRKALGTYSVSELLEALEGARLKPFVRYGTRVAKAVPGCGRKDDLADVLRDETTIEECRGICQRARMSPAERLWAAYRALSIPAEAYWRLAVDAAVEVPGEPDDSIVVDGIVTRP